MFDEDQYRSELEDYYFTCHRPPGESLLIPELHHSNPITQQCSTPEQLRRDDVNRTRIYVRVLVNNYQVSQTKDWYVNCHYKHTSLIIEFFSNLNSDFSLNIGEVFTIHLSQWPESIKLEIFEVKLHTSKKIAEIFIPIPDIEITTECSVRTDQYQFTSEKIYNYSHSAVGSGLAYRL